MISIYNNISNHARNYAIPTVMDIRPLTVTGQLKNMKATVRNFAR